MNSTEGKDAIYLEHNQIRNAEKNITAFNVLHLDFANFIDHLRISHSYLGRLGSKFIDGSFIKNIEIINNTLQLDNENIVHFKQAEKFLFADNTVVETIITEALNITVSDMALIINNSFEHLRRQSFANIRPKTQMSKLQIQNNDFYSFELGFLDLDNSWSSQHGVFDKINLRLPCDCSLLQILDALDANNSQGMENKLLESSFCNGEDILEPMLNLYNFTMDNCEYEGFVIISEDDVLTGSIIGAVALVIIILIIFLLIRKMRTQLSEKAVQQFVVHPSRILSDSIEDFEKALPLSSEAGSIPDLLNTLPDDHLAKRSLSLLRSSNQNENFDDELIKTSSFKIFNDRCNEMVTEL